MRRSNKPSMNIKEITKQAYNKFKKVRDLESSLFGNYSLYCRNSQKYMVKQLPLNFHFVSTRTNESPIFKYNKNNTSLYLFPLLGEPLEHLLSKCTNNESQIYRWIFKCGSLENCLFQILKKILLLLQDFNIKEILLDCFRIYNGELIYSYDTWMNASHQIVAEHSMEIQNYYFSQEDLTEIKNKIQGSSVNGQYSNSKTSIIFRTFLFLLHLGTSQIKQRNYEFGQYKLHHQHLKNRMQHFLNKYHHSQMGKWLAEIIRKVVIEQKNYDYEDIRMIFQNYQKSLSNATGRNIQNSQYSTNNKSSSHVALVNSSVSTKQQNTHSFTKIKQNHHDLKPSLNNSTEKNIVNLIKKSLQKSDKKSKNMKQNSMQTPIKKINEISHNNLQRSIQNRLNVSRNTDFSNCLEESTQNIQENQGLKSKSNQKNNNFQGNNKNLAKSMMFYSSNSHQKDKEQSKSNLKNKSKENYFTGSSQQLFEDSSALQNNSSYNIDEGQSLKTHYFLENQENISDQKNINKNFQINNKNPLQIVNRELLNIKPSKNNKIQKDSKQKYIRNSNSDKNMIFSNDCNKNGFQQSNTKQFLTNSNNSNKINLKKRLLEPNFSTHKSTTIPLLKYLSLNQYIPENLYESNILQMLSHVCIKDNWEIVLFSNGSIYFGEIFTPQERSEVFTQGKSEAFTQERNNKNQEIKHGKGLYLFNTCDLYYGDWKQNLMDGYGINIYKSGQIYEGDLQNGQKYGHGRYVYSDGRQYEGSWIHNSKAGLGKVKFPNQVTFLGVFHPQATETEGIFITQKYKTKNNSKGELIQPFSEEFQGILELYDWESNQIGQRKMSLQIASIRKERLLQKCQEKLSSEYIDQEGNVYSGEINNGKRDGFGIFEDQNEIYEGEWANDKREGKGKLVVKGNYKITGQWQKNLLIRYDYQDEEQNL